MADAFTKLYVFVKAPVILSLIFILELLSLLCRLIRPQQSF